MTTKPHALAHSAELTATDREVIRCTHIAELQKLLRKLTRVGVTVQVRNNEIESMHREPLDVPATDVL
jgi:hypothetical protein